MKAEQWGARSVDHFEKLEQIGEGTYGQVYMARNNSNGEIVALKKVRMDNEKEGFPITAIREIKILKSLDHKNVITLKEIVTSKAQASNQNKGSIYMVFEYMDHDLTGLADRPGMKFSIPQIKCYMKQLLTGLHYCHRNNILHRDIKGSNLLIDNNGILKLADFGLARSCASENAKTLTNRVITLWYRPPELLLGAQSYGPAVDLWSAGCIFAELLHGKPILPGKNEMEQLDLIFKLCGTPTPNNWPDAERLPWAAKTFIAKKPFPRRVHEVFRRFPHNARSLVDKFLTLDPSQRISSKDALDSDYFWEEPMPSSPKELPKYEPSHEFQTRKRRQDFQRIEDTKRLAVLPDRGEKHVDRLDTEFEPRAELQRGRPDFHERGETNNAPTGARYGGYRGALSAGSWATATTTSNQAGWTQPGAPAPVNPKPVDNA